MLLRRWSGELPYLTARNGSFNENERKVAKATWQNDGSGDVVESDTIPGFPEVSVKEMTTRKTTATYFNGFSYINATYVCG